MTEQEKKILRYVLQALDEALAEYEDMLSDKRASQVDAVLAAKRKKDILIQAHALLIEAFHGL